jgi:predicted TPR repeat methyltransferase
MSYRGQEKSNVPGQPLFVSSGDLIADRRYHWALEYLKQGDPVAAAEVLVQVVDDTPGFATAWFALATIREQMGDRDGAIAAFKAARDADCEDYHGARLHLARLGVAEPTPAMTASYVRRLFDQHAPEFEESLVDRLGYRGPAILMDALAAVRGQRLRFGSVLDLGCGTGLAGAAIRPFCDWLIGVDLSLAMIERARAKDIYDRLSSSDLSEYLADESGTQHHLVLAADVFVYCGDLSPIITGVAGALAPGGLLAFTVETHNRPDVQLQSTLRYAHGIAHVRTAIERAGLQLDYLKSVPARREKNEWLPGLVVVASAKPSSGARPDP